MPGYELFSLQTRRPGPPVRLPCIHDEGVHCYASTGPYFGFNDIGLASARIICPVSPLVHSINGPSSLCF